MDLKPQLQEIEANRDAAAAQRPEQERKTEAPTQHRKFAVAESAEHKFLEAKHESIGLLLLDALRAEDNCTKVDTYDACESRFKPIMSKIDAEGDLVIAQLAKADECKKT